MSLFLKESEVAELTGYQLKRYQIKWLRENGWPFELDKDGKPKVLRDAMLARCKGNVQTVRSPRLRLE